MHSENAFEIDSLLRVEVLCRNRLARQPEDTAARISLAWCLFLRSLHRAGQESVLSELAPTDREHLEVLLSQTRSLSDQDAFHLVQDSLRNTFTVMQLSGDPRDVASVERLQALARLSGADKAVVSAEENAVQVVGALLGDIMTATDAEATNGSNGSNGSLGKLKG